MEFESYISKIISKEFPLVEDFRFDFSDFNVNPINRINSSEIEYPPVAKWRVGKKRFSYVLNPTFIKVQIDGFLFIRKIVDISYQKDYERLFEVVRLSTTQ